MKVHPAVTPEIQRWIAQQRIFFVSTSPLAAEGHINCSPKGGDTFRVLGEREVAYVDLTGSGVETISHLQENGRILIMFCAFEGPPKIVRLHGKGEVLYPSDPDFVALAEHFPANPGARAIIRISVNRVSDSCGYSVPLFGFVGNREVLDRWAEKKGDDGLANYRRQKNATSIDGLPGYQSE